uniref:Uncharacterized protein n=1 Tax=Cannabis sativa TaxID=3483 RepID=A0A803NTQ8_CANSA
MWRKCKSQLHHKRFQITFFYAVWYGAAISGWLDVIVRGPHLIGNLRKALEKYARSMRHEPCVNMLEVEERPPKTKCFECDHITFAESDTTHVWYPHNDPLVVEIQIANMMDLEPCKQLMYDFSEASIAPCGKIKLPLTVGKSPHTNTIMVTFIVVDTKSLYNAMTGRPSLYDLRAISSIFYLFIKFSMPTSIGRLLGNQRAARECYNTSLVVAKKTSLTTKAADEKKKTFEALDLAKEKTETAPATA